MMTTLGHHRRSLTYAAALTLTATLLATSLVATNSAHAVRRLGHGHDGLPSHTFAAIDDRDNDALDLISESSGKEVARILPGQRGRLTIAGVSRLRSGVLLVTYATGPQCTSGVDGCGPTPKTCGAEVTEVSVATGHVTVLWRVGRNRRLTDAVASPDGGSIVARTSPCVPSYFNDHLVVRRLSDGQRWSIGGRLPRCHFIGRPAWTAKGDALLVPYASARGKPYHGPDGTCPAFGATHLRQVPAFGSQGGLTGTHVPLPGHCRTDSVASGGGHTFVIGDCGRHKFPHRTAKLFELPLNGQPHHGWFIGHCPDGTDVTVDGSGRVLMSAYLFCNPPRRGHKRRPERSVLDRLGPHGLHQIAVVPKFGNLVWDDLVW